MGFGVWGLGFGVWGLGFGVWGLGFGVWGMRLLSEVHHATHSVVEQGLALRRSPTPLV